MKQPLRVKKVKEPNEYPTEWRVDFPNRFLAAQWLLGKWHKSYSKIPVSVVYRVLSPKVTKKKV